MFVVEIGSVLTTILFFADLGSLDQRRERASPGSSPLLLWFTVLFANFAEAMAEGRGKAQADTLRKTRAETVANGRRADGTHRGGAVVRSSTSATTCVVVGRRGDPRRRRDHRGHRHRSTSRPSPASRPRSSASPAATARRSPAAPGCCPTEIVVRITAEPGRDLPRPHDRPGRGRRRGRRRRTRSPSTSCWPGSRSSSCWPP